MKKLALTPNLWPYSNFNSDWRLLLLFCILNYLCLHPPLSISVMVHSGKEKNFFDFILTGQAATSTSRACEREVQGVHRTWARA